MTNDKLASHISSKLWNVSKEEIVNILASYEEDKELDYSYIHVSMPPDTEQSHIIETLQDCVNDLNDRVKQLEAMEAPTLKRNLSLDNTEQEYLTPEEQLNHNQWRQQK
jgi:hypothetical protein